jgi:hypothetical protein
MDVPWNGTIHYVELDRSIICNPIIKALLRAGLFAFKAKRLIFAVNSKLEAK